MCILQDVVLLRVLAGDFRSSSGSNRAAAVARDILARDGIGGFYRGLGASMATSLPSGIVWWATYEAAKVQCRGVFEAHSTGQSRRQEEVDRGRRGSKGGGGGNNKSGGGDDFSNGGREGGNQPVSAANAAAAFFAGTAAAVSTHPIDVCKTRLQTQQLTYGTRKVVPLLAMAVRREGAGVLWKGLLGRIGQTAPLSVAQGLTYELVMHFSTVEP